MGDEKGRKGLSSKLPDAAAETIGLIMSHDEHGT